MFLLYYIVNAVCRSVCLFVCMFSTTKMLITSRYYHVFMCMCVCVGDSYSMCVERIVFKISLSSDSVCDSRYVNKYKKINYFRSASDATGGNSPIKS